jgi:starch phosphorylase
MISRPDNSDDPSQGADGTGQERDPGLNSDGLSNNNSTTPHRSRSARTVEEFKDLLIDSLYFAHGQALQTANPTDAYLALCYTVRDQLMERYRKTTQVHYRTNPKFIYYLSMEYLLGRQLPKNMLYTGTEELASGALAEYSLDLDRLILIESEPGLGNGGLGRLAACFLDSLATMDMPCVGYGIRYQYGIFRQEFRDGWQHECPDDWTSIGAPWEFPHPEDRVKVGFGGHVERSGGGNGHRKARWFPDEEVQGEPYHILVPGYGTNTVNTLRLWRARASEEFDYQLFDVGDYAHAVEEKVHSENISRVLYPNDNTPQGKELRLKQQYFFVACSLRDIIRRFQLRNHDWARFPDKVVIQLNDTHPVIAIPELMRILIDEEGLAWERAWEITQRTFAYTCHTLLPEALETWPVALFERLLPRHLEIIYEINDRFLVAANEQFGDEPGRIADLSLIGEGPDRHIRMAHLACVGSFSINGVAELQSRLIRERTLKDFADLWPEKFNNKTNGVTPRRFIRLANPRLSDLITSRIGDGWLTDLDQLSRLEEHVEDGEFREAWRQVKLKNKVDLAAIIEESLGVAVDPSSIYDVMVKRLHEYKRQLLMALHIITHYRRIKADPGIDLVPRTFIFGAKAAPGYQMAKLIIKLINSLGDVVNADPDCRRLLKVAFLPNFNVSLAQRIYPAADISEQISLAGKEASGTGNMKFALNGALTTGTLDGANIEIRDRVGEENFFLFGMTADEVFALKEQGYRPRAYYEEDEELRQSIDALTSGVFSAGDRELFRPIVDSLLNQDTFMHLADYRSYIECQRTASEAFRDVEGWTRKSILNVSRCGFFSSDRSVRQYCDGIWRTEPVQVD